MDESKTYPVQLIRLAAFLDALSHPARLEIIEYLALNQECAEGSISDKLPLCKSSVSQHLTKLKEVGIISCKPQGACKEYCLNDGVFEHLKISILDFIQRMDELKEIKVEVD